MFKLFVNVFVWVTFTSFVNTGLSTAVGRGLIVVIVYINMLPITITAINTPIVNTSAFSSFVNSRYSRRNLLI